MPADAYLADDLVRVDETTFELSIVYRHCSGFGALFGGTGLGAGVRAMEQVTGRPLVWATGQFVSFARPGEHLRVVVTVAADGRRVSQARAFAHVGDREVVAVHGALGVRQLDIDGVWVSPLSVPPPDACEPLEHHTEHETIMTGVDRRVAAGTATWREVEPLPDGRPAMWVKTPADRLIDAAWLSVLGDYVPWGTRHATGVVTSGQSLDNTIRVVEIVQTDWVLVDVHVHSLHNGFAHGVVHMWAEDGTLLATASQTCQLRRITD